MPGMLISFRSCTFLEPITSSAAAGMQCLVLAALRARSVVLLWELLVVMTTPPPEIFWRPLAVVKTLAVRTVCLYASTFIMILERKVNLKINCELWLSATVTRNIGKEIVVITPSGKGHLMDTHGITA
jgi:hypothetical protein